MFPWVFRGVSCQAVGEVDLDWSRISHPLDVGLGAGWQLWDIGLHTWKARGFWANTESAGAQGMLALQLLRHLGALLSPLCPLGLLSTRESATEVGAFVGLDS